MKLFIPNAIFMFLVLLHFNLQAQNKRYSVADAHAHNDYEHKQAFYDAFGHGFGSIEADIFEVNNELFVAHNQGDIKKERTLRALYLDPILHEFNKGDARQLRLLIDMKGDYRKTLPLLIRQLTELEKFCATPFKPGHLNIVISGNRPKPQEYADYPDFIFFDDDLVNVHSENEWQRVGLVSLNFKKFSDWTGKGQLPLKDEQQLKSVIDLVHARGKAIRFWGAPDTQKAWQKLAKLNVDVIGTDKIEELTFFLSTDKSK